jgi:hypothetical protein
MFEIKWKLTREACKFIDMVEDYEGMDFGEYIMDDFKADYFVMNYPTKEIQVGFDFEEDRDNALEFFNGFLEEM